MPIKSKTTAMINQIGALWLTDRWIELIDDAQRDVAELLSDLDPMFPGNHFERLRQAIIDKKPDEVCQISEEMYRITEQFSQAVKIILDLRARITSIPEVYGGNGNDAG